MAQAREGMAAHLASFTHNTSEFLSREQDLLLHGRGIPGTRTTFADRPVVVVATGHQHREELKAIRRFVKEARPVLVGVDGGADALLAAGHDPDVVVVTEEPGRGDRISGRALRAATDVVVRLDRGSPATATAPLRQMGVHPLRLETGATAEDAALILAQRAGAAVIVGVGMHATLDEFLDRRRGGVASTFLTRLAVGPTLVDASSLPLLYSGRVRPRHLLAVTVAGLLAARRGDRDHPRRSGVGGRRSTCRGARGRHGAGVAAVIAFRQHVVTLVALFLALAVGIVLGVVRCPRWARR